MHAIFFFVVLVIVYFVALKYIEKNKGSLRDTR